LESPNRVTYRRTRDQLLLPESEGGDEILQRLAAAVILSAVRDAAGKFGCNTKLVNDAKAWLLDEENELWFDIARIDRRHIPTWLGAGCRITNLHKLGSVTKHPRKYYPEYELKTELPPERIPIDPELGPDY
jgi:hypothetical protein